MKNFIILNNIVSLDMYDYYDGHTDTFFIESCDALKQIDTSEELFKDNLLKKIKSFGNHDLEYIIKQLKETVKDDPDYKKIKSLTVMEVVDRLGKFIGDIIKYDESLHKHSLFIWQFIILDNVYRSYKDYNMIECSNYKEKYILERDNFIKNLKSSGSCRCTDVNRTLGNFTLWEIRLYALSKILDNNIDKYREILNKLDLIESFKYDPLTEQFIKKDGINKIKEVIKKYPRYPYVSSLIVKFEKEQLSGKKEIMTEENNENKKLFILTNNDVFEQFNSSYKLFQNNLFQKIESFGISDLRGIINELRKTIEDDPDYKNIQSLEFMEIVNCFKEWFVVLNDNLLFIFQFIILDNIYDNYKKYSIHYQRYRDYSIYYQSHKNYSIDYKEYITPLINVQKKNISLVNDIIDQREIKYKDVTDLTLLPIRIYVISKILNYNIKKMDENILSKLDKIENLKSCSEVKEFLKQNDNNLKGVLEKYPGRYPFISSAIVNLECCTIPWKLDKLQNRMLSFKENMKKEDKEYKDILNLMGVMETFEGDELEIFIKGIKEIHMDMIKRILKRYSTKYPKIYSIMSDLENNSKLSEKNKIVINDLKIIKRLKEKFKSQENVNKPDAYILNELNIIEMFKYREIQILMNNIGKYTITAIKEILEKYPNKYPLISSAIVWLEGKKKSNTNNINPKENIDKKDIRIEENINEENKDIKHEYNMNKRPGKYQLISAVIVESESKKSQEQNQSKHDEDINQENEDIKTEGNIEYEYQNLLNQLAALELRRSPYHIQTFIQEEENINDIEEVLKKYPGEYLLISSVLVGLKNEKLSEKKEIDHDNNINKEDENILNQLDTIKMFEYDKKLSEKKDIKHENDINEEYKDMLNELDTIEMFEYKDLVMFIESMEPIDIDMIQEILKRYQNKYIKVSEVMVDLQSKKSQEQNQSRHDEFIDQEDEDIDAEDNITKEYHNLSNQLAALELRGSPYDIKLFIQEEEININDIKEVLKKYPGEYPLISLVLVGLKNQKSSEKKDIKHKSDINEEYKNMLNELDTIEMLFEHEDLATFIKSMKKTDIHMIKEILKRYPDKYHKTRAILNPVKFSELAKKAVQNGSKLFTYFLKNMNIL